jgi:hypothetical protein
MKRLLHLMEMHNVEYIKAKEHSDSEFGERSSA